MKTRIEHTFDLPADQFFEKVFYNEEFNEQLFKKLNFKEREVHTEDRGDTIYRVVRQVPERDIPGPVKKVLGSGRLEYEERSTYRKGGLHADIEVIPSLKPEKVKIHGKFWVEPMGDARCRRIFELEVKVSVFGVGGLIEKTIIKETEESYDTASRLTAEYLRDQA